MFCRVQKGCCDAHSDHRYRLCQYRLRPLRGGRLGYQPLVTADPDLIRQADKVFLRVGTAGAAMENLTARGLVSTIRSLTQPVLGICLGMQLLGTTSEEGNIGLLGLIDTPVQKMTPDGLPVPHMGWNTVEFTADLPLFRDIAPQSYFTLFTVTPARSATPAATTTYGEAFSSVLCRDNFTACSSTRAFR